MSVNEISQDVNAKNTKLVEILYEGALYFCDKAKSEEQKQEYFLQRSQHIFRTLLNAIDYEHGEEVAVYLGNIYTRQIALLENPKNLDFVIQTIHSLLNIWQKIRE